MNVRQEELLATERRLRAWEANKHKYPNNTQWWRDFYLSPNHAETEDEAQELIRAASDRIAAEEVEAKEEAQKRAKRAEAINKTRRHERHDERTACGC